MESLDALETTMELVFELLDEDELRDGPSAGVVLQAYLRDSPAQLDRLLDWARATSRTSPLTVRLVKGAYWDHEVVEARQHGWAPPVFEVKAESDRNFEELTTRLLDARPLVRVAIASHNLRSVAHAVGREPRLGRRRTRDLELQILRGLGDELQQALAAQRAAGAASYCPVGDLVAGMAYLVRQAAGEHVQRLVPGRAAVAALSIDSPGPACEEPAAVRQRADIGAAAGAGAGVAIAALRELDARLPLFRSSSETTGAARRGPRLHRPRRAVAARGARGARGRRRGRRGGGRRPRDGFARVVGARGAAERAQVLRGAAAAALRERRLELAALMVRECAKPWAEADADVCEAIDFLEYYARGGHRAGQRAPSCSRCPASATPCATRHAAWWR